MSERKVSERTVIDPFKPSQPRIPGVSNHEETPKTAPAESVEQDPAAGLMEPPLSKEKTSPEKLKTLWVGLTLLGAIGTLALLFTHSHRVTATSAPDPLSSAQTAVNAAGAPKTAANIRNKLPIAPGVVASKGQLAKPWSSQQFLFRDVLTGRTSTAMVVRLPGGALWAFSLRPPYGSCDLEYVTDLRKLQSEYDFPAGHPMVTDPCTKSVFDLTRYGSGPSGLVRGEVVKGSAFRPPLAIEVGTKNDQIVAIRSEQ